jgi:hypothetical protein
MVLRHNMRHNMTSIILIIVPPSPTVVKNLPPLSAFQPSIHQPRVNHKVKKVFALQLLGHVFFLVAAQTTYDALFHTPW